MEIKPQDYIYLYLGCDVSNGIEVGKLVGVTESEYERGKTISLIDFGADSFIEWYAEETKPILRKLSEMTEEESAAMRKLFSEMADNDKAQGEIWADQTRHMLKQGFDLFGLIPAGLAIDKTSLKN